MDDQIPQYYGFSRPEVQALVPTTARRVLDVGCAAGLLGEALKARGVEEVYGIECDPRIAAHAAKRLDKVIVGDVEALPEDLPANYFDCIVLADVLEHLRNPQAVLEKLRASLTEDGLIVASIPNVGHWSVLRGLLEGRWQYENAGILDRTHLRFFTRQTILHLFNEAGFKVESVQGVTVAGETIPSALVEALRASGLAVARLQEESRVYQYLITARARKPKLTSIVILTHNGIEYTKQCVDSIRQYTSEPYELIFVDNGSTDGTIEYLEGLEGVTLIQNPINLGFAAGCNQGMSVARGEYIMLLNNDTIVTPGWLTRLITRVESDPAVGMVGPRSNYVAGPQLIRPVPYGEDLSQLPAYATSLSQENAGLSSPVLRLVGFCLLMKRAVIDMIGGLDERFGLGNYEDDDFCIRAWAAGFRLLICHDVFVHHFGSRTFAGERLDYVGMIRRNWDKFKAKWGLPQDRPPEAGYRVDEVLLRPFSTATHYCPLSKTDEQMATYLDKAYPRRGFSLLAMLDWPNVQGPFPLVMDAYLAAFRPEDDVTLVILAETRTASELQSAAAWLEDTIRRAGLEPENAPDILLSPTPESPRERLALYQAVQAYLPSGETGEETNRRELSACGCQVVEDIASVALRRLASSA
ncbi:MAG: glycosyltransferase [Betaproteobacteria bacterium]